MFAKHPRFVSICFPAAYAYFPLLILRMIFLFASLILDVSMLAK